jgi:hypothetical protein
MKNNKRVLQILLVALAAFYFFASTLPKHADYWAITNMSMAFAVDPLHYMALVKVDYPPTFYALQGTWLKFGALLFHYNLVADYNLTNSTFYSYYSTSLGLFPLWGMIPILTALFALVGVSYKVLKNNWLSLLCFGPITFVTVVLMGQVDVFCALFIFVSLILMQKALHAQKYFSLLLLAYLGLGISMQFKTYGGLLLPAYLIFTLALAKDKKLDLAKSFFTLLACCATFLVAVWIVWLPYLGWFNAIILHGESKWLLQYPSPLVQTVALIWVKGVAPIWPIGYAFILCYMAVRVLGNSKRALQDDRYFVFYNFAIVAWFFIAVFTDPQWWMFLVPVALLALDNFQNKNGVLFCVIILAIYLLYPLYWWNWESALIGHSSPAISWNLFVWVFTILAGALLFWVLALKRELEMLERNRLRVENTNENYENCLCYAERCPTYNRSSLTGGLFCARGGSEITPEKRGCVCPSCPVWAECKLNGVFFCVYGVAQ